MVNRPGSVSRRQGVSLVCRAELVCHEFTHHNVCPVIITLTCFNSLKMYAVKIYSALFSCSMYVLSQSGAIFMLALCRGLQWTRLQPRQLNCLHYCCNFRNEQLFYRKETNTLRIYNR